MGYKTRILTSQSYITIVKLYCQCIPNRTKQLVSRLCSLSSVHGFEPQRFKYYCYNENWAKGIWIFDFEFRFGVGDGLILSKLSKYEL